jgi:AraC-like DNA-binding protein
MTSRLPTSELLHMSYYRAPAVFSVSPHVIPKRTELVELVIAGVVYFRAGDQDWQVGCGALFWHVAGEETIHRTKPDAPYECLVLTFTARTRSARPAPRLSIIPDHQRTRELCQEFLRAYHDEAVDRAVLGDYARHRLLWEAYQGKLHPSLRMRPLSVDVALNCLEAEFRRPDLGVSDLARAAGISEPHLHALFREHLDQTPHHLLVSRRIREAKWLLSGTSASIKAIASNCGFPAIETFYRAFKRTVGTTPFLFRATHSRRNPADL